MNKFLSSLFPASIPPLIEHILQILFIIFITWCALKLVNIIEKRLKIKYNVGKLNNIRERRLHTKFLFLKRLAIILILVISFSFLLMSFEGLRKLGAGLLASTGVLVAILGFAAQKSLGNLMAGFQIAFTQPIRIDDVLVVENEWGRVEEITLTYVVIRLWDQRRLILPINYFLEKPFQNWTRTSSEIIGSVFYYVDYCADINLLRAELTNILQSSPLWDGVVNVLQVTDFTEKAMQLRALVGARNSSEAWDLRCYAREKLMTFMQEKYPHFLATTHVSFTNH